MPAEAVFLFSYNGAKGRKENATAGIGHGRAQPRGGYGLRQKGEKKLLLRCDGPAGTGRRPRSRAQDRREAWGCCGVLHFVGGCRRCCRHLRSF